MSRLCVYCKHTTDINLLVLLARLRQQTNTKQNNDNVCVCVCIKYIYLFCNYLLFQIIYGPDGTIIRGEGSGRGRGRGKGRGGGVSILIKNFSFFFLLDFLFTSLYPTLQFILFYEKKKKS